MARKKRKRDFINLQFGRLTVIKQCEQQSNSNGKLENSWLCKCTCGNKCVKRESILKNSKNRVNELSCGCVEEEIAKEKEIKKQLKRKMTEQENADWEKLYEYVRTNIMKYDKTQSLSRTMVLRLKGLKENKFMANKKIENTANYSFETILTTFKFCSIDIQNAIQTHSFRDENHKFNYILKIVEDKINTVYMRLKNAEKSKEKTIAEDIDIITSDIAEYQTKTKITFNKRLEKLW